MIAMSSRIAQAGEVLRFDPIAWPTLADTGEPSAALRELQELRATLAGAVEELRLAHARVAELERTVVDTEVTALNQGRAEGTRSACEAADRERAVLLDRISHSIADLAGLRGKIRSEAECDLVKLSLAIARRVIHREMSVDPAALLGVVRSALARIPPDELTKVRLHPSMVKTVRFQLENLRVPAAVEIESDPTLEPGDLVLETLGGLLDASVDAQLQEIHRGFCDRL